MNNNNFRKFISGSLRIFGGIGLIILLSKVDSNINPPIASGLISLIKLLGQFGGFYISIEGVAEVLDSASN